MHSSPHPVSVLLDSLRDGTKIHEKNEMRFEFQEITYSNKCSGDGHSLLLSATQHHAALSDHCVIAVGECLHEIVNITLLYHTIKILFGECSLFARFEAIHDVLANRSAEQNRFLTNSTNIAPQPIWIQVSDVDVIQKHTARLGIVQAKQ